MSNKSSRLVFCAPLPCVLGFPACAGHDHGGPFGHVDCAPYREPFGYESASASGRDIAECPRLTVIASGTGGVRLDAGERRRARYAYDAAELRYIAARALLKAAETDAEADGWPTEALEAVAAEREAVRSAERNLESAREECEQAGVIINAHPALSIL